MLHSDRTQAKSQASTSRTLKILLADDQKFVQQKLIQILSPKANLQVVGVADDGKSAITLVETLNPDVVLIDIEMPKMNGIEAATIISQRFPDCKILVLSSHENPEYVQQIISSGADGYILKTTPAEDLVTAIRSVYRGYSYFGLLQKVQLADDARLTTSQPKAASSMLSPRKRYRFAAKFFLWSGILSAVACGGWFGYDYYQTQSTEAIPVSLTPVEKGTVEITVSESGKVELGGQQTLKSPGENATVEEVQVKEGDRISAGDILLVLRDRDAQEQEQEQELENGKFELTQARNQEKVAEAEEKVVKKQAKVTEAEELFSNGYIPETELDEDRENLDTAEAELADARLELETATLETKNGREKLVNIQQKLQDRLVTSDIDGVVLGVKVKNGDGITTDTKLLTIGDPNQEMVKLQLTSLNAARVKLNQQARVSAIGPNPQTYTGRVIQLSPEASSESEDSTEQSMGSSSDDQAKVNATVKLDKPSNTLIPGSSVNVEIISQQRQDIVTLPIEMVQKDGEKPFVWVKDEQGKAKQQPITLGLEDLTSVEVTSGLKAGQQIILPPPDMNLTPGVPLETNPNLE
ncbi:MAG: response regulator [Hydrococcus sp. SU_1_0]|nr:response regulator [Hydrococcus sp. SU_1_0]NJO97982.1 response regulator [Pleurocapsa sp. CRU_1_2]